MRNDVKTDQLWAAVFAVNYVRVYVQRLDMCFTEASERHAAICSAGDAEHMADEAVIAYKALLARSK